MTIYAKQLDSIVCLHVQNGSLNFCCMWHLQWKSNKHMLRVSSNNCLFRTLFILFLLMKLRQSAVLNLGLGISEFSWAEEASALTFLSATTTTLAADSFISYCPAVVACWSTCSYLTWLISVYQCVSVCF